MAVEVKLQSASVRDEGSDDASSVTAVSYEEAGIAVEKGRTSEATTSAPSKFPSSAPASPRAAHRTPEDILRLTQEDTFFQPCPTCSTYRSGRDVQLTFYNLDTHRPCCSVCKNLQGEHAVVQVRRSSYHDVVRVSEIVHLFDITHIQPYWINNDRVVFLRPRPQPRPPRGCSFPAICRMCHRQLMDMQSRYCSLQCKLQGAYDHDPSASAGQTCRVPHWGKVRKRSVPAESSLADDKDFALYSPRAYSEDEDGFSSGIPVPLSGSKKRKLTPVRSPLE